MSRLLAATVGLALFAAPLLAQDGIAPSPAEIEPLLIGAGVPDVTVRTIDDQAVKLPELLRGQKSILIFYRGGW